MRISRNYPFHETPPFTKPPFHETPVSRNYLAKSRETGLAFSSGTYTPVRRSAKFRFMKLRSAKFRPMKLRSAKLRPIKLRSARPVNIRKIRAAKLKFHETRRREHCYDP